MLPLPSLKRRKAKAPGTALVPRRPSDLVAAPISAFESEVAAVVVRTSPYSEHAILHAFAGVLAVMAILLAVVKVDEVVTSTGGDIESTEGPLYVQPYALGIVHQMMVKVGDIVKKGQVLATLDPTFAAADETQAREHLASDQAMIDRLDAEAADKPYLPKGDGKYEQLQLTQWRQRQQEYKQNIAGYDAQILATKALVDQARSDVVKYTDRLKINAEMETMRVNLEKNGWGSRLLTDQASDQRTEIARLLADAHQTEDQQSQNLKNLVAQRAIYIETWKDYIANNLVTTRNDYDQTMESLKKAAKVHELIKLTSPADAVVLQIASASTGSIVQPSTPSATSGQVQPMFTLTPLGDKVMAKLEVDSEDIAFVHIGDPVTLKVDAFPFIRFGTAEGVVRTISDGSFTMEDDGSIRSPFFKVWVEVSRLDFYNVPPKTRLTPGMTLVGDVHVGKRTLLTYIVQGVLRNANEAMREP